jgi:hypothetical protein
MIYRHTFTLHAPVERVRAFHARPEALAAITPPPIRMQLRDAPASLDGGGQMRFTLWFGPLPVHWTARIANVTPLGFTDAQEAGPFRNWVHRHAFQALGPNLTEVRDEIEIGLRPHLLWGPLGLGMVLGLPVLFAFRARRTRRFLEGA